MIGVAGFQAIVLTLFLLIAAQVVSAILAPTLFAVGSGAPASARLRGLPTRAGDLVRLRLKSVAIYTLAPALVYVVSLAIAFFGAPIWVAVAVWGIGMIMVRLLLALGRGALLRWLYSCAPIERTEWAALGPRIQAWAQLAGTPLRAIYVRHMAPYDTVDWSIVGLGRRQELHVNDMFLVASDWRMRDAYTGLLLGVGRNVRRQGRRRLLLDCVWRAATACAYGYLLSSAGAFLLAFPTVFSPAAQNSAYSGPARSNWLVASLLLLGIALGYNALIRRLNRNNNAAYLDADGYSVDLVGDPLALVAALYLVWDYPSGGLRQRLLTNAASQQRATALQQRLSAPGPFAPWSSFPILSPIPIMVGPYLMSVPPTLEAVMAAAPPVPSARYPIRSPILIAPLMPPTAPAEPAAPHTAGAPATSIEVSASPGAPMSA